MSYPPQYSFKFSFAHGWWGEILCVVNNVGGGYIFTGGTVFTLTLLKNTTVFII